MIALKTWAATLVWAAAQLATGGSVTGSIHLQGGRPAVGVRVVAIEVPTAARVAAGAQTIARITQTDSNGRYSLDDVAPGRYYIAAGPLNSQTFHPGTPQQNGASVVTISRDNRIISPESDNPTRDTFVWMSKIPQPAP